MLSTSSTCLMDQDNVSRSVRNCHPQRQDRADAGGDRVPHSLGGEESAREDANPLALHTKTEYGRLGKV